MKPVLTLFEQVFLLKHGIVPLQHPQYSSDPQVLVFSCFQNWKFISAVKFKLMENIKRNTMAQLHIISKEEFQVLINWKLTGIGWMPRKLFWRKLTFHRFLISVFVNNSFSLDFFLNTPSLSRKPCYSIIR